MPKVIHFELPADDTARARAFYEKAFGSSFTGWEGAPQEYWLVMAGPDEEPGINGGLLPRQPGASTSIVIGVPSLDDTVKKVEAAGGKILERTMVVPGVGYMAVCIDSEGNTIEVMQEDPSAA